MLLIAKLAALFAVPLGAAIVVGLLVLLGWRLRRTARLLLALAVVALWTASMPITAKWLMANLESAYPPTPIDQLPRFDVAIVLGGMMAQSDPRTPPDLGDPVDRVLDAWRIYRAGRAGSILVTGGNLPWVATAEPEAVLIKRLLVELGVPDGDIVIETASANTRENAMNTIPILAAHGWVSALLVTSASHVPRALAAFEKAGARVTPFASDIHSGAPLVEGPLDLLPDAAALAMTTDVLREWLGLLYYRLQGWA